MPMDKCMEWHSCGLFAIHNTITWTWFLGGMVGKFTELWSLQNQQAGGSCRRDLFRPTCSKGLTYCILTLESYKGIEGHKNLGVGTVSQELLVSMSCSVHAVKLNLLLHKYSSTNDIKMHGPNLLAKSGKINPSCGWDCRGNVATPRQETTHS